MTELLDPSMNRSTQALILKTALMKRIDAFPHEVIHDYTDKSAFEALLNSGYGDVIIYPNIHSDDNQRIIGPFGQNFQLHCRK
jgi:hypothetical protein